MRLAEIESQDRLLEETVRKLVQETMAETSSSKGTGSVTTAQPPTDFKTKEEIDVEIRVQNYQPIKARSRKVVNLPFRVEDVVSFLYSQLPLDIEIVGVGYDSAKDTINVLVKSENFAEVPEGEMAPLAKVSTDVDPNTKQLSLKWNGETL